MKIPFNKTAYVYQRCVMKNNSIKYLRNIKTTSQKVLYSPTFSWVEIQKNRSSAYHFYN